MRSALVPLFLAALTVAGTACTGGTDGEPAASPTPTASAPAAATSPPSSPSPAPSPTISPATSPTPSPTPAPPPDAETVYDDPDELAGVVVEAERTIRDPELPADRLAGWAWVQQAVYRQLAARPDWQEQVLTSVPEDLREAAQRNLRATAELRALTEPQTELPPWRIVAPPPADELLAHYRAAAEEFGLDWTYLAAIHLVETRMGRIRGDSTAGARGPMQFLPSTWDAYGEGDIEDPGDAIRAAARYLADHGAPGNMDGALWAYNHSDHYVRAISDHAAVMRADVRAYHAYYHWQVYYRMVDGDVILPHGWDGT